MKKVAFMFVAALAISFASCGGQTKATEETADSVVAEVACDSASCDSVCADSVAAEVVEVVEAN